MKITIKRLTDWDEVKDSTLCTIGKRAIQGKAISSEWKSSIIRARHSPIRDLMFSIRFDDIPRWLADELRTHPIGVNPKMTTWRKDRGGIPRHEQRMDDLTTFKMNLNAEAILNISMKRLCHCAAPDMVILWEGVVKELAKIEPELARQCAPSCIRLGGCPEDFSKCNMFKSFADNITRFVGYKDAMEALMDFKSRYNAYALWVQEKEERKEC